ncbi:MAG: TonB-dependent receptor [Cyclobacteriaceae bacterium]|nr:TonB-dependent receptor [Cyclobacteriaceae bacterium]
MPLAIFLLLFVTTSVWGQTGSVRGVVRSGGKPVEFAHVGIEGTSLGTSADEQGHFLLKNVRPGKHMLQASAVGYRPVTRIIHTSEGKETIIDLELAEDNAQLNEVVVTGTMKEVTRLASPIPVEVYSPAFFRKNPTPNIFESLTVVNGVQPQVNCNVCNTGDIHINGLEGPYTMILIDGMPIVSSLSTVYGLAGIPNNLVKRMEIIKGPASTLYGSEAVGGVINIITQDATQAPSLRTDAFATSVGEYNLDVSSSMQVGKSRSLLGLNYFNYTHPTDINSDNFTDVTLQKRVSLFNKWSFYRPSSKNATLAVRYVHENRWGGEMQWNHEYRGSDVYYGESIYTDRAEVIGNYAFKGNQDWQFDYSWNYHLQDSYYGTVKYFADQQVAFAQLRHSRTIGKHDLLVGLPFRFIAYDDNTPGTSELTGKNKPSYTYLPGIFLQDEIRLSEKFAALLGGRYDHHNIHGNIFTERVSLKYSPTPNNTFRLTSGSGFRVVNLFTEDHAALTGSRQVVLLDDLKPEKSWNVNLNYTRFIPRPNGYINLDASLFYTYFTNKIVPDYVSDPNEIRYSNLDGYAVSRGLTVNMDAAVSSAIKLNAGITLMDVYRVDHRYSDGEIPQLQAPRFSGTFAFTYTVEPIRLSFDLTGKVNGPMYLPVVPNDFRPAESPWFGLLNLQVTKSIGNRWEVYGAVKNLLNYLPSHPLLHPDDPFDRRGGKYFDAAGAPRPDTNPYGYTFDTTYNYAPMQGAKGVLGIRYTIQ